MSVWDRLQDFQNYVYKTVHGSFFKRRDEWFDAWPGPNYVIWDFAGTLPPPTSEGWMRLSHLTENGPSDFAYDFKFAAQQDKNAG